MTDASLETVVSQQQQLSQTSSREPAKANAPSLTVPQWLAFAAFVVFVGLAAYSSATSRVLPDELVELRKFTLFFIGAILPSDALIRFGRNLLFQTVEDADAKAKYAPATTIAQKLAFAAFLIVVALTLLSDKVVSAAEFAQINEVARVLMIALLPSDAGIRFGRALYYRAPSTPIPTAEAMQRV